MEIIQVEKKRGEKTHFRSLAFLNRPPAIFTPPEIAQSHEIKPCSVKPAKQKDNLQAGTVTEGPLFAGPIGCFPALLAAFCPRPPGDPWGSRSDGLGDPPRLFAPRLPR